LIVEKNVILFFVIYLLLLLKLIYNKNEFFKK